MFVSFLLLWTENVNIILYIIYDIMRFFKSLIKLFIPMMIFEFKEYGFKTFEIVAENLKLNKEIVVDRYKCKSTYSL